MCTLEKRGSLHILTITGPGDHRFNPTLIEAIRSALDRIKCEPITSSSALITTAEGKFFSNGLDLAWTQSISSKYLLMLGKYRSLISDLISLPMPTIAAINGHAAAGGLVFALSHDYVLMRKDRGFLYLSDLDVGIGIPPWGMALIECKVGKGKALREMVLRAAKMTAKEAGEWGLIDAAYDSAEGAVKAAIGLGEQLVKRKWDGHVYAQNRMVILREVLDEIESDDTAEGIPRTGSKL
ncbi:enoyl-CoA delta isomerase 1, peroxisomal-like [Melia azedarach]|uniref:Enoyl-CoA delta isomerase 1, peroxisomal-like n=1 Tax=Melia azedarach TaxID=155640 RepID=A0ACC1Y4Y6_MELAZ|nr:enoyl-CoA delta isomerase 1, peroxisomal-like [Melia azedarach]